jgi:hypothetical protein
MIEVTAIIAGALLAAVGVRAAAATRRHRPLPAPAPAHPPQLARVERAAQSISLASDVQLNLRPLLREIAAERLRARGVDLDRRPADARRLLGEALWELVRPDRPPPDRHAGGLTPAQLDAMLDRLEEL